MHAQQNTYQNGASFFQNVDCPYFPCHEGVEKEAFNCLFCYCPLYALGPECGGNYRYTERGIKDCTYCTMLHKGDAGAAIVKQRFGLLQELARQTRTDAASSGDAKGEGKAQNVQDSPCDTTTQEDGTQQ